MFGTSGIRGIVGKEIDCHLMQKVGQAFGKQSSSFLLARDTRNTSLLLLHAFASGLMQCGVNVVDMGICPTPALAFATKKFSTRGAVITASHNPPQYNGVKLFDHGIEIPPKIERRLEKKISKNLLPTVSWNMAGSIIYDDSILQQYKHFLLSKINRVAILKRKPKVAIDCANGAASNIIHDILNDVGIRAVFSNCSTSLPLVQNPEPTQENLRHFSDLIKNERADIGIALDPDADRAVIFDNRGRMLGLDRQLAIMCSYLLSKNRVKKIVTTVEASLIVKETIERHNGKLYITPVGSGNVARELIKRKALFGGEPCGEYVFSNSTPTADGLLSCLKFLELISVSPSLISDYALFPSTFIIRKKYPCQNKKSSVEKIIKKIKVPGKISLIDGLRIDFDDGWILIRSSGTEDAIRLTIECKTEKKARKLQKELEETIFQYTII
ncbi:MAG: hypothetical protein QXN01_02595 [Candidatus Anstonellales archaeon]